MRMQITVVRAATPKDCPMTLKVVTLLSPSKTEVKFLSVKKPVVESEKA